MSRFFLLRALSKGNVYSKSKAIADALFLEANDPDGSKGSPLLTLSIRMPPMYGERDMQMIHGALIQLNKGQTHIQIGDNWNLCELLYIGNAARAHILACRALLAGTLDPQPPKVDGEAFLVSDDAPLLFWDSLRKIWTVVGDKTSL